MNKLLLLTAICLVSLCANAQDKADYDFYSQYNGRNVKAVNITTNRIKPEIVKRKFTLKEGQKFSYDSFDDARKNLHEMKVFKKIDFTVTELPEEHIEININCNDGDYIFPLIFGMGGSKTTIGGALMEVNKFKHGELASIMAIGNSDGFVTAANLTLSGNTFSVMYNDFSYEERQYANGSYNSAGLFSNGDDDLPYINEYELKHRAVALTYAKNIDEKLLIATSFAFKDVDYNALPGTLDMPTDAGSHNMIIVGAKYFKNIKPSKGMAGAFGSVFGLGTSDVQERIANLPRVKPGYTVGADYRYGGDATGADFNISSLAASAQGNLELKTRHILAAGIYAAQSFEGGFSDMIKTSDVTGGLGKYAAEIRGEKGWGSSASAAIYLAKNTTGILVLQPFVETAYLFDQDTRYNQTGAGANLTFMFWRFQFPLGINYTKNTADGEQSVSFMFGGAF